MSELKVGLIGGSGLGVALAAQTDGKQHALTTPFGPPSAPIIETEWEGVTVLFLARHGPGHTIPPSQINFRANLFALKALGCTHVLASGAVGSLRENYKPRDLVLPDQVIDKTFRRVGTFYDKAAVHVEFAEPFCPVLRQILQESAEGYARIHAESGRGTILGATIVGEGAGELIGEVAVAMAGGVTLGHLGKLMSLSAWTWWPAGPRPKQAALYPRAIWLAEAILFVVGVETLLNGVLRGAEVLTLLGALILVGSALTACVAAGATLRAGLPALRARPQAT